MPALPLSTLLLPLVVLLINLPPQIATAQDVRVNTTVRDLSGGEKTPPVISHSLTLFHAGKVYDYMEEVGEVIIFEPMHHRFILLGKNYSAAEVPFAEVNHFLDSAHRESLKYIQELAAKEDASSARLAASIQFQLRPRFEETFEATTNRLVLNGGHLDYRVTTATTESTSLVRQYLEFADWLARLNYVLHPNSGYPAARLELNENLRSRELLPLQVELNLKRDNPVRLRADHSYSWELQPVDKKHIHSWELTLQSERVRWMTFREYQQQILAKRSR